MYMFIETRSINLPANFDVNFANLPRQQDVLTGPGRGSQAGAARKLWPRQGERDGRIMVASFCLPQLASQRWHHGAGGALVLQIEIYLERAACRWC